MRPFRNQQTPSLDPKSVLGGVSLPTCYFESQVCFLFGGGTVVREMGRSV